MILQATIEDLAALARLESELFGDEAWGESSLAAELSNPQRLVFVATDEPGAVVGYAVVTVVSGVADLLRIGVARDHQNCGFGGDLLDETLGAARAEAAKRMLLEVSATNSTAIEFYRAYQFTTIDRRASYYRDGSDALVMERTL